MICFNFPGVFHIFLFIRGHKIFGRTQGFLFLDAHKNKPLLILKQALCDNKEKIKPKLFIIEKNPLHN